jgi:hypothetical protein
MLKLPFFPDQPSHRYTVNLDGAQWDIRLTYVERSASWVFSLYDADGKPVITRRRLSPGASPVTGLTTKGPPGLIIPYGRDPYGRYELEIYYMTADEVAAILADRLAAASARLPVELLT